MITFIFLMTDSLRKALVHTAKYRLDLLDKELASLFEYIGNDLLDNYWKTNQGRLTLDHREKRHIANEPAPNHGENAIDSSNSKPKPKTMKSVAVYPVLASDPISRFAKSVVACATKSQDNLTEHHKALDNELGTNRGIAIDLSNMSQRGVATDECILTIFPDGHCCKEQQPSGVWFIVPKQRTLSYNPIDNKIDIITPDEAERADDLNPYEVFYTDSKGCSRPYKFLYSMKICPQLYNFIKDETNRKHQA